MSHAHPYHHHHRQQQPQREQTSGSATLFPSSTGSPSQQTDLASWVDHVRQRNSSISTSPNIQLDQATSHSSQSTPASDLELDFQRQRVERQQRRLRLSSSGVRGITASNPASPLSTPSIERTSVFDHSFSAMVPSTTATNMPASPLLSTSPSKASGVTGIKRANSLLARYGGQYGPTGNAAGPQGPNDAPVSLANFMGGRAAGPRLGKLVGDGKSAPPEADMIHESRRIALPGLAAKQMNQTDPTVVKSLASFLGERADTLDGRSVGKVSSSFSYKGASRIDADNVKEVLTTNKRPVSPVKYLFSSAELGRPGRMAADSMPPPPLDAPPSPKKAYLELIEKRNATDNSAPTSPIMPRASSPSKFQPFGGDSVPASPKLDRPPSPFKTQAPTKSLSRTEQTFSRPLPIPSTQSEKQPILATSRKDAATSPLKPEDLVIAQFTSENAESQRNSGPTRDIVGQRSQMKTIPVETFSRSDAPTAEDPSNADRLPTASLSRLSAKKMVGQRIKEAQLRNAGAQKDDDSAQSGCGRTIPSSPAVRDRWPPAFQVMSSPSRQLAEDRKGAAWSPTKYGNALPGLAGRSPTKDSSSFSWRTSPKKEEALAEAKPEPIRLPGMGASTSPFKRFTEAQKQEVPVTSFASSSDDSKDVLQPLTKSRVRGPVRKTVTGRSLEPTVTASGTQITTTASSDRVSPTPRPSTVPSATEMIDAKVQNRTSMAVPKPLRHTTGKRIHVLISGSGSNLQSLIDATLLNPPAGLPTIGDAHIAFVLSNRKAAYGLTRAADSNPPIPTKVLSLKTWQTRNPGGTREEYDRVLAKAVLDGPSEDGSGPLPDLIVLAGFMHIVSEPFLHALGHPTGLPMSTPTIGLRPSKPIPIINLHPALPGAFDGANAIPRAFEAYKEGLTDRTGCMVHEVVADVDRGRPIIVREVPILPSYSLEELEEAIHKVEHIIIVEAADLVLKGYLEELDRSTAADKVPSSKRSLESGTAQSLGQGSDVQDDRVVNVPAAGQGRIAVASATSLLARSQASLQRYVLASDFLPSLVSDSAPTKSVSVEVLSINSDGSAEPLDFSGDQIYQKGEQLRREQIVYEDETLVVVQRRKSSSGLASTSVWVRTGLRSVLHPFELGPSSTSCLEGRKVAELAQRYSVKPTFVAAGCENDELISVLAGSWAISRQGSRRRFDPASTSLYRVRRSLPPSRQSEDSFAIQQVDLRMSNLCSGDSFVISVVSSLSVWHGKGSLRSTQEAAVRFAQSLAKSDSSSARPAGTIAEIHEGEEVDLFWHVFERGLPYASAWYHSSQIDPPRSDLCSLLDVEVQGQCITFTPYSTKGWFGPEDLMLPTRSSKVSILNLSDRELFVVVGKDARSDRMRIAAAVQAAESLSLLIQDRLRRSATSVRAIVARPAVDVLVLPSMIPLEIRAAARIWSDEVIGYLEGAPASRMNVHTSQHALDQLQEVSWPLHMLRDLDFLPVGLAPDDVRNLH